MNQRIVSIDLGSAYTKIAFRNGSDAQSVLIRDLPLATKDLPFCIPSVVAKVTRRGEMKWVIGAAAASQLPGEGVTIYRNWKAGLFHDTLAQDNSNAVSDLSESAAAEVAVEFFSSLRTSLKALRFDRDLTSLPVRICIPKLGDFGAAEKQITEIVKRAGWQTAETRVAIAEPVANALGIMSRGFNKTWIPRTIDFKPLPGRCMNLPAMIKAPGLLQALHSMLQTTKAYYGVLVIDIGAFTTDFGYVRFDASFIGDSLNRPEIFQQSFPMGIRNLDSAVVSRLSREAQEAIRSHSSTGQWESVKPALYKGDPAAVTNPRGGVLHLGKGKEAQTIKDTIIAFSEKIWELRTRFCESLPDQIHAQALTGGGSLIPTIRNTLTSRVKVNNGIPVRDLLEAGDSQNPREGPSTPKDVESRARQIRELVRGGSAIGASSIFFE